MSSELVLAARRVVTLDGSDPTTPRAVGIQGGRIEWVGPRDRAAAGARVLELDGVLVPGLVDAHAHLLRLGEARTQTDLRDARSPHDAASRIASVSAGDGWVLGHSWDQTEWPGAAFPTAGDLRDDVPVALRRVDGHALWVNAAALALAGVTAATPDPPGGLVVRDARGEPTGVLLDAAMGLVMSKIPEPGDARRRAYVDAAVTECHRAGLTGVHDMGATHADVGLFRSALPGRLRLSVYLHSARDAKPERDDWVDVVGVKLFADGALGSSGAWLLEPYSDDPANRGIPVLHGDRLRERVSSFAARGLQVAVHAIGDAAARDVLDAFEHAGCARQSRFRVEHAQVVHPDDRRRMARMGAIASMQPTHCTSDMRYAEQRLGDRVRHAYAWRSMLRDGVRLALGSDFPVESPDPLAGLAAATTRAGWYPQERLTPDEALRGFTTWAAYAGFAEERRGRIARGLDADLTVLSGDPLLSPIEELSVVATVVGGEIVFAA